MITGMNVKEEFNVEQNINIFMALGDLIETMDNEVLGDRNTKTLIKLQELLMNQKLTISELVNVK